MTNKSQILFIIAALLAVISEAFVSTPSMLMHRADTKLHLKTTGMYLLYIYLYCDVCHLDRVAY